VVLRWQGKDEFYNASQGIISFILRQTVEPSNILTII
jgi:hypothetical protein